MRVCGFCHQSVVYAKQSTCGFYVHSATGQSVCTDVDGEQHDCNARNIPVTQWELTGTEVRRWWRRWKIVRRVRKIERPAPGVRIIREHWDAGSSAQWPR